MRFPKSDALMARTLVLPINIKMDEAIFGKVEQLVVEANKSCNKFTAEARDQNNNFSWREIRPKTLIAADRKRRNG